LNGGGRGSGGRLVEGDDVVPLKGGNGQDGFGIMGHLAA